MNNIGLVIYRKNIETGELTASWCHSDDGGGSGIATGPAGKDYCGDYRITYFDENATQVAKLDLQIRQQLGRYLVTWLRDGKASAQGIGLLTDAGLAVGYQDIG